MQIAEGLRYVWANRLLRATAAASAVSNFSFAVASAVSFIFLTRTLGLPPAAIGLIIAGGSVTVAVGAAVTPGVARRVGSVRLIWLSLATTTPLSFATALAQTGWLVVRTVIGMSAGEFGQIVYAITSGGMTESACPSGRRGPYRRLGRIENADPARPR